jgi:membrane protease YdiL (CAAX protease family)
LRIALDDPRLRAGLALAEAVAVVVAVFLTALGVVLALAPRSLLVLAEASGQLPPRAWAMFPGPRPPVLQALAWTLTLQNGVLLVAGAALALWRTPRAPARVSWPARLAWGLGAGLAAFAVSGGVAVLQQLAGIPVREQEPLLDVLRHVPLAAALPWVALAAPLGEEAFFRGYLFRFLEARAPLWLAYAFSAAAFAAIHLNPSGLLVYAAIALVLAWAYRRTASLAVPVLAHAVHNTITLVGVYATLPGAGG